MVIKSNQSNIQSNLISPGLSGEKNQGKQIDSVVFGGSDKEAPRLSMEQIKKLKSSSFKEKLHSCEGFVSVIGMGALATGVTITALLASGATSPGLTLPIIFGSMGAIMGGGMRENFYDRLPTLLGGTAFGAAVGAAFGAVGGGTSGAVIGACIGATAFGNTAIFLEDVLDSGKDDTGMLSMEDMDRRYGNDERLYIKGKEYVISR